jgi:F-type H+-transporting ATPase subunit delta
MSVSRIASRYAKSLVDLAEEQGKLDRVLEDVQGFIKASEDRGLALLLKSPIIQGPKKISIIEAIFKDKMDKLTLSFLRLIVVKGRESYLRDIALAFVEQYRVIKKISAVRVTSAVILSNDQLEAIKSKLASSTPFKGTKVELETKVDPSIVGGLIIEIGDRQYDASVIHHLEALKNSFQN